jgi:putative copper export protein
MKDVKFWILFVLCTLATSTILAFNSVNQYPLIAEIALGFLLVAVIVLVIGMIIAGIRFLFTKEFKTSTFKQTSLLVIVIFLLIQIIMLGIQSR